MASRVVLPGSKKIEISNGDWLLVKTQLNAGEERAIMARTYTRDAGKLVVDPVQVGRSICIGYLIDWSLTDPEGGKLEIRDQHPDAIGQALDSIDLDSFDEIRKAIEAHAEVTQNALAEEKKLRAGGNASNPT